MENLHSKHLLKTASWKNLRAVLDILMILMGLQNKTNKCRRIKYVLSHIINYQHVSVAFTIIRVALQSTTSTVHS